ncbi:ribonuclease Z [Xylanibacter oryzae]|uniref:ribonuclease Z n=1 Tax=Xylanibacter oryzae TaxID=185293 RepID=UPI0004B3CB4A|nr:ribonuclease Z [Xylanibacter oryzae]
MEPFKVHVLGCGSALPTLRHSASSQIVEIREKMFMIDCGEGTQMQLRRSRIRFTKISAIFISHLHGDHCFGLIGLISTFGLLGRTSPLHIYAPSEYKKVLDIELDMFCKQLGYELIFHPVNTTLNQVIYEDKSLTVSSIPLDHRMPCCGFIFVEKPTSRHIIGDMMKIYEVPISQRNNIKNGADWTTPDGEVIKNEFLTKPADSVRSYAYCSDTKYLPNLHTYIKNVNLLYHESTYSDEFKILAAKYYHSTARQAASVARDANAGKLMLGHYSSRYESEQVLLDEAKEVFPNTILSEEMKTIDV